MATHGSGALYSPQSPDTIGSPDTMSPIYPDRPIRPLPRRRLRERLSPDVADVLLPTSNKSAPRPERLPPVIESSNDSSASAVNEIHHFRGNQAFDEDLGLSEANTNISEIAYGSTAPQSNGSSIDSQDGYDSFEHTNNKKKRKMRQILPAKNDAEGDDSAVAANNGREISPGLAAAYLADAQSHGRVQNVAQPILGAARGRSTRNPRRDTSGRMPLASSPNSANAWRGNAGDLVAPLAAASLVDQAPQFEPGYPISQENIPISGMHTKAPPAKTQFTFSCDSELSRKFPWTSDSSYDSQGHPVPGQYGAYPSKSTPQYPGPGNMPPSGDNPDYVPPPKPRRPASKRYAAAARERRLQQEYNNFHHPPRDEDIWICEFCEYESIFGRPPSALIRQYEIKDRRERKRLAEKRRLLEKAKMKGRRNKKNAKSAKQTNAALNQTQTSAQQDQPIAGDLNDPTFEDGREDDDYGDESEDDGAPYPPPDNAALDEALRNKLQKPYATDPGGPPPIRAPL